MMWPGAWVKKDNKEITYSEKWIYSDKMDVWKSRIDKVLTWLTNVVSPANLVMLYFGDPDEAGHFAGPDSDLVKKHLKKLDLTLGYLLDRLKKDNLTDVNIVITSDHGMSSISKDKVIDLTKIIPSYSKFTTYSFSPMLHIRVKGKKITYCTIMFQPFNVQD